MKSSVLNVSIDTETPEGEKLRDLILSNDFSNGWMCVSWVDRAKYNQPKLLRESEEARMKAVEEAVRLNGECEKMYAWIEEAKDMILSNNLHQTDFYREGTQFKRLIDEAPV
jgi:hypothetical protein